MSRQQCAGTLVQFGVEFPCTYAAKHDEGGAMYCGWHAPSRIAARADKKMGKTHPLITAALRAHRGETAERFAVMVAEVESMRLAVLAVLRGVVEDKVSDMECPTSEANEWWRGRLEAIIREIEG